VYEGKTRDGLQQVKFLSLQDSLCPVIDPQLVVDSRGVVEGRVEGGLQVVGGLCVV
jgi:hypothetical protein